MVSREENNKFKNKVHSKISKSKLLYYSKLFDSNKSNMRKTWNIVNALVNRKQKNTDIKMIMSNNVEIFDSCDISEIFNDYFSGIAHELDANLPTNTSTCPLSFINSNSRTFFLSPISSNECSLIIKKS